MDEALLLDGKRYISSKRAAEITGYTKDYIGQLCRGGKVDARLVGRSWYVGEDSICDHKTGGRRSKTEVEHDRKSLQEKVLRDMDVKYGSDRPFVFTIEPDNRPVLPTLRGKKTEPGSKEQSVAVHIRQEGSSKHGEHGAVPRQERPAVLNLKQHSAGDVVLHSNTFERRALRPLLSAKRVALAILIVVITSLFIEQSITYTAIDEGKIRRGTIVESFKIISFDALYNLILSETQEQAASIQSVIGKYLPK